MLSISKCNKSLLSCRCSSHLISQHRMKGDYQPRRYPLQGVRVLDMSRVLAGPWATQYLGDMGADVIKVEHVIAGDDTRHWGPPHVDNDAAYFMSTNRNKRSIAVNIKHSKGQKIISDIAKQSDVLIENFKKDGLGQYGLDYSTLSAQNPGLIYCSVTGFGQDGPRASQPGYDFLIQAMGGLMSITGSKEENSRPQKVGVAVTDIMTGMYASSGILTALYDRDRNGGQGTHIDVSLFDTQLAFLANQAANYLATETSPVRMGNSHPNIVPYDALATADGYLVIAVGNDKQFQSLCLALGLSDMANDPRFHTNEQRVAHRTELIPILEKELEKNTRDYWTELFEKQSPRVPCGPINTIGEALNDPQAKARNSVMEHQYRPVRTIRNPIRYVNKELKEGAPPRLGSNTAQVLEELLGIKGEKLRSLVEDGAIRCD